MEEIIVDHFHYNFFPCAFDVQLTIDTPDFEIVETYGTPFETKSKECVKGRWTP